MKKYILSIILLLVLTGCMYTPDFAPLDAHGNQIYYNDIVCVVEGFHTHVRGTVKNRIGRDKIKIYVIEGPNTSWWLLIEANRVVSERSLNMKTKESQ